MSFLDHIRRCNTYDPSNFRPFEVEGHRVGSVLTGFATRLAAFPDIFTVRDDRVLLSDRFEDPGSRTLVMREVARRLSEAGALPKPRGEDYAVVTRWGETPFFLLDRGLVSAFGVRAFGVHVNGYVRHGSDYRLWIGRRAADRLVEPNKLDNIVAGGQPAGLSLAANVIKEAEEEAGIPQLLAEQAKPAGAITYCMQADLGLRPDTLFVYDLEMPADFVPTNRDGEIASFTLMPAEQVAEIIRTTRDFKFNVPLVVIDFLIRHGLLSPDDEADYLDLICGLRARR